MDIEEKLQKLLETRKLLILNSDPDGAQEYKIENVDIVFYRIWNKCYHFSVYIHSDYEFDIEDNSALYDKLIFLTNELDEQENEMFCELQIKEANEYLDMLLEEDVIRKSK